MKPKPKTGLRLRWARLLCHWFGHDSGRIVKYSKRWVLIGEGCRRCEVGTVRRYRTDGPLPAAVKEAVAAARAEGAILTT